MLLSPNKFMAEKTTKKYTETIGRRKTASARVRLTPGSKFSMIVNGKEYTEYFPTTEHKSIATAALDKTGVVAKYEVTAVITGGGIHGQAEALRHGIARALVILEEDRKTDIKKLGFLKRDPRAKERRKFGLKKARKAPQWSKR
jgi:small subunit ribosomal protein S9